MTDVPSQPPPPPDPQARPAVEAGGERAAGPDAGDGAAPRARPAVEAGGERAAGPDAGGGTQTRAPAAPSPRRDGAAPRARPAEEAWERSAGPGARDGGNAREPGADPEAGAGPEGVAAGDPWPPDEAFDAVELDDRGWVRRNLEAILLVADEPVPAGVLGEIVGSRLSQVEELLVELAGEYARDGRGFVLRAVAGGWRLYTNPAAGAAVEAFLHAGQRSRLTRAALETLAVIAYRQPVTRFQVAAVRGVNVDGVFRTLLARGLIQQVGSDDGPGQASLYGTAPAFLEQLGLNSLDQLPPIKDYLPEGVDLIELQEQP